MLLLAMTTDTIVVVVEAVVRHAVGPGAGRGNAGRAGLEGGVAVVVEGVQGRVVVAPQRRLLAAVARGPAPSCYAAVAAQKTHTNA